MSDKDRQPTSAKSIRPMTDKERKRAVERQEKNNGE